MNPSDRCRSHFLPEIRIPARDFASLSAINITDHSNSYRRGDRQAFNDASGRKMHRKSRELVAWQPQKHDDEGYNDHLLDNDADALDEEYDQFEANNIDAHFDENMYTSKLDKSTDEFKKHIKEAEEAEKHIMNQ